jgi:CheY-like chemotaxis protein
MPRALLVDDKPDVLDFVGEILEHSLQHEFHPAYNNEDARKLLQANDYDYVLLDLRIPASRRGNNPRVQNGVSLFHQILKIKGTGKVPVIIMTSHTAEALLFVNELQNDGLTFYLAKDLWDQTRTVEAAVSEALAIAGSRLPRSADGESASPPRASGRRRRDPAAEAEAASTVPPEMEAETLAEPDAATAADPVETSRWASIPNAPIELDDFMARFCEHRSKENRMHRKRALLAAARHKTVTMPPLAAPRKHGQANKYFTHDLLAAWQRYRDEGVELPPLLAQLQQERATAV